MPGLGLVAMSGLMLYNRYFSVDSPASRTRARQIMIGLYSLLLVLGAWFLYRSLFGSAGVAYRTAVQATIMLLLGAGGIAISFRKAGSQGTA